MASLNWTDQSVIDLTNIADFIAKDSIRYAKITINRIKSRTRQLKEYPNLGRIVPEIGSDVIREVIVGNYRIIYQLFSLDRIDILTVHHSAKRLDSDELGKHAH